MLAELESGKPFFLLSQVPFLLYPHMIASEEEGRREEMKEGGRDGRRDRERACFHFPPYLI